MNPMLNAFHFLRPWWLLALPVSWLYAFWLARRHQSGGDWSRFIDPTLLSALRLDGRKRSSMRPWPWLAVVWSLAIIALSGPSWQKYTVAAYRAPAAWMVVFDLSPSMSDNDVAPDRVTRARYGLVDLLDAAHDAKVGLVAFADDAFTVTPLTDDIATIKALLPPLAPDIMPTPGDHLAPGLQQAGKLLSQAGSRDQHAIVFSDGFDDPAAAFSAAAALKAQGVAVDVVGVGSAGKLDVAKLQQLATVGGGQYVNIANLPDLISHLQLQSPAAENAAVTASGIEISHWLDAGVWLLPLILFGAALLARRDWL